jgi:predicted patatin/cPLA2 family phospholipase
MSLDYLIYHVMAKKKVLNWQVLLNSPIPLVVVASSVSRVEPVGHRAFESHEQLLLALKAGATLPLIAGPPVHIEGDDFLDAMVFERIPYRTAIADGCTHILALLTRPPGQRPRPPSVLDRLIFGRYLKSLNPRLSDAFFKTARQYQKDIARLVTDTVTPSKSPHVYAVQVAAGAPRVARMEKDRQALVDGAIAGAESVFRAILGSEAHFVEVLRPYNGKGLKICAPWA